MSDREKMQELIAIRAALGFAVLQNRSARTVHDGISLDQISVLNPKCMEREIVKQSVWHQTNHVARLAH